MEKLPPLQKIYEAWSALADGRVEMGEDTADVASSNGAKHYTVSWTEDTYSSNDNASYWQGYAGYPVLAVLMKQGKLPCADMLVPPLCAYRLECPQQEAQEGLCRSGTGSLRGGRPCR